MEATLKQYRQSPRKVRLVASALKGRRVPEALTTLSVVQKRAARELSKLIRSAVANAEHNHGKRKEDLYIRTITVNEGITLKRMLPRAFGRATLIRKRTSHVHVVLDERAQNEADTSRHSTKSTEQAAEEASASQPAATHS